MERNGSRMARALKKTLVVTAVTALALATMGLPATADDAKSSSASAYALQATGTLPIARTPEVSVSAPPDDLKRREAVLNVPAAALAVEALLVALAEAHFTSGTKPTLTEPNDTERVTVTDVNARGYSAVDNLDVLVGAGVFDCNVTPELCQSLVNADLIESEAVAKCVNNQPQFDTGYNILALDVAGLDLGTPVEGILNGVLNLLAPGGSPLAVVATVERGRVTPILEGGQQVGVAIDALVIRIPLLNEEITIAHSEARMPRDCAPLRVAAPPAALAVTGGGGLVSLIGGTLVAAAVLMMIMVRRSPVQE